MFVGHKRRTKEETKKMLSLTKRLDERKKKLEQDLDDAIIGIHADAELEIDEQLNELRVVIKKEIQKIIKEN